MNHPDIIISAVVVDDMTLTVDDLAHACGVQVQWLAERIEADLLGSRLGAAVSWRFGSRDLKRARRLAELERMFDINPEAAAFIADLLEETERLRGHLARQRPS